MPPSRVARRPSAVELCAFSPLLHDIAAAGSRAVRNFFVAGDVADPTASFPRPFRTLLFEQVATISYIDVTVTTFAPSPPPRATV